MLLRLLLIFAGWGVLMYASNALAPEFVGGACFGWFMVCALLPVERMLGPRVIIRDRRNDD